jgi:hypothetical protein
MVQGDASAFRAVNHASTAEQQRYLDTFCELMIADNRLLLAIASQFGRGAADGFRFPYLDIRREGRVLLEDIGDMQYVVDGDNANGEGVSSPVHFAKVEGQWLVAVRQPDSNVRDWEQLMRLLTANDSEQAGEVERGTYRTAREFEQAYYRKLETWRPPASQPSNRDSR